MLMHPSFNFAKHMFVINPNGVQIANKNIKLDLLKAMKTLKERVLVILPNFGL